MGYWHKHYGMGACRDCLLCAEAECQVLEGREKATECPVFQEFVDLHEIRLLGPFWADPRKL